MDSPLLPQFDRQQLDDVSLLEDPSLLADLSMDSDVHSHASSSNLNHQQHLSTNDQRTLGQRPSIFSSTSSSSHPYPYRQQKTVNIQYDDDGEETPNKISKPQTKPRFSLFAPTQPTTYDDEDGNENEDEDQTIQHSNNLQPRDEEEEKHEEHEAGRRQRRSQLLSDDDREDRLRSSLYELRKMNEVFEGVIGAMEGVRGHNQRLAERVRQTSALLDEYTAIMGQAEHTQKLLLNTKWTGSTDDAEAIAAIEQARLEAIERAEEESRRAAEQARLAEEERERRLLEKERAEASNSRGARGRGVPRGSGPRARGTGIPRPSIATSRPTSSTTGTKRGTTSTTTTRGGGGLGGQYNHVKSSGYGPR
ncbi:hypothetical protein L486_03655 [Kwoniella mangroviensis CBS 10435]|uniref:DASH complex subunit DUO1 n=1 Tax=Kwoniella mangroviensis CBS 10435 TaxID=1331196 RepID=A0A1B9IUQ1_9TREE|nr:hypothetical protein L486_03655 [Kwoniella mangroviensis CBS 10435]